MPNHSMITWKGWKWLSFNKILWLYKLAALRLVHKLARQLFHWQHQLQLLATEACNQILQTKNWKRNEIWSNIYPANVVLNREWTRVEYELWNTMTTAAYGLHCEVCDIKVSTYWLMCVQPMWKQVWSIQSSVQMTNTDMINTHCALSLYYY
jgi:hypothetical protein